MLFAAHDYIQYKKKLGRYERDVNKSGSLMGAGFDGAIPIELLARLKPGDVICIQNFDWWASWLIMYLTSSSISHVAQYLGNGRVGHMALDGLIIEPVQNLYKPQARFLPFVLFMTPEQRAKVEQTVNSLKENVYYDKVVVMRKGLLILSGRAWSSFRWRFFLDVILVLLLLDLIVFSFVRVPVFSLLIPPYLLLLLFNRLRWARSPRRAGHPEEFINSLFATGRGMPLLDVHLSRILKKQNDSS